MDHVVTSMPAAGVGQILLDEPPRNIPAPKTWVRFEQALGGLQGEGARVVVIGSAVDGYFVGHGSLEGILDFFGGQPTGADVEAQTRVMRELDRGPMVSIAAIDGQAWGGGAELCWACDLRVASRTASFAQPEVNIGLTPGWGGITKVAHLAGEAAALRLALDGRPIDGEEAHRLGLAHRVTPPGKALADALVWAEWLASRPEWALQAVKRTVKTIRGLPLRDGLREELRAFAECASRPEALELVRAAQSRYDEGMDSPAAFGLER